MDCGHGTYQCGMAIVGQQENGQTSIVVPMWCTTCGAIILRLPPFSAVDQRRAELTAKPARVPVGRAAR